MKDTPYLRVGTAYYKMVHAPTIAGHFNEVLVHWNIETIRHDHGKDYLAKVPKYDGFTCIPSHIDYRQVYKGFYNTYSPLSAEPMEGTIDTSLSMVRHIFGGHYELGLDYLQLLYTRPVQVLPILCLVSIKRNTGKTTFLKWLRAVFENNMTYLTNDSFASQFNADWANRLLICIEEVLFNREELTERIKYLSTTNINKLEAKGRDKREVEFFGKFILCSNNEHNFIKIDGNETRFWVLKVPIIEGEDPDFLDLLKAEIPAFLYFLKNRKISTRHRTRMWFTPEQIRTPALQKLVTQQPEPGGKGAGNHPSGRHGTFRSRRDTPLPLGSSEHFEQDPDKDGPDAAQTVAEKGVETGEPGQFPELPKTGDLAGRHHGAGGLEGTLFYRGKVLSARKF